VGRLVASTNNAMYCRLALPCPDPEPPLVVEAVYKPILGERPLDDFPDGTLGHRELAAYLVSEAGGWGIVPPTVIRDGPFGEGAVQAWVDVDPEVDVVAMVLGDDPRLRPMAVFDACVNNTDRKGGHVLPVDGGRHVFGVDHGVCFSTVPKLRTLLWAWRGQPFEEAECEPVERLRAELRGGLATELRSHLSGPEVSALVRRVDRLLTAGRFPQPSRSWPAIPWPPF
jgi:hypothetical protein